MARLSKVQNSVLIIFGAVVLSVVIYGCARGVDEQSLEDRQVVARINDYRMSVADFKDGVDFILASKYLPVEPNEAKQELLNELITRNILLQEAQREGLDKKKAFMREIEKHWKESLLELLLKMKSTELSKDIYAEDSEVIDEYQRMKRKIFAQLLILNDRKVAQKFSSMGIDGFDTLKESVEENIVSEDASRWWVLGDLPQYLEKPLFSLNEGQVSPPVKCGNNWAVMKVIGQGSLEIEAYEDLAPVIRKNIRKQKKEQALQAWIGGLRKSAFIKINKKLIDEIILE